MNAYEIERFVLDNAVNYDGKANLGSVIGALMGLHPELRNKAKELTPEIKKIVEKVNSMDLEEQKKLLREYGAVEKPEKVEKDKMPELGEVKNLVVRFAPNPNGAISFGHCRPALWNWFVKERYKGKYLLRFDDTDPQVKPPVKDAYDWFKEDLKWLGVKPSKVIVQSKRLKTYYKYAQELINLRGAYVCTCKSEKKRELLHKSMKCSCEDAYQTERWKGMFDGKYKAGEAVLRVKTDINAPNPAVRDWAAFRIVSENKHPLDSKSIVWPLLNFASAIDDHEFKVTHIIRGIDLSISDDRQKYLYNYFGWRYPKTMYHGKLLVEGIKSTSETVKLMEEGKVTGWDDPSLGTIKSLRRRGFSAEAVRKFMYDVGIKKTDINVSFETLASFNRELIDAKTERYFFVENPQKIRVSDAPDLEIEAPLHPDLNMGVRKFNTHQYFYISDKIEKGILYRFMHLFNFTNGKYHSAEMDKNLKAKLIHWLPVNDTNVNVSILMNDGSVKKGLGESALNGLKVGSVIQFERFGFVRLDSKSDKELVFVFGHK
ncbi:glutamate--tRNA ligase [Candidatus Woesearchaeota archaeon]|jgi:glutamyl-tRNA synthetase|nr:glutamate--tRNA ligase [Candidatus Woesearchaeota archaeon]MBT7237800.1 glutamate--tRNA ligase [Candidatus Woesearchaeota archaeon]